MDTDLQHISKEFLTQRFDVTPDVSTWKLLITHDEIQQMVQRLANIINQKFQHYTVQGKKIVITCILKGCAYFLVDLTKKLTIPHSIYFIEASSYHDKQLQSEKVELLSHLVPSKFQGRKVILLDELYDNGFTLFSVKTKIIEELKIDPSDIFTCTLFQKAKVKNPYELPDLVGFANLPDLWYVGYGLDDKQEKRNWIHLYAIPKLPNVPKNASDQIFDDTEEGRQKYRDIRKSIVTSLNT